MGGSTKCCSIEERGSWVRGEIATPTREESADAASETRCPQSRKVIQNCLPGAPMVLAKLSC